MNWYKLANYQTVIQKNKYGKKFLAVIGNTFSIKDQHKNLGFSFFKGIWSISTDALTEEKKQILKSLDIDLSSLDSKEIQTVTPASQPVEQSKTQIDVKLEEMKQALNELDNNDSTAKSLLAKVDSIIDKIANMTDEASKTEFVKDFLKFASKFHQYSFGNQILIWMQNRNATYVAGFKKWTELGRQVVNWKNPITIIAPFTKKITEEDKKKYNTDKDTYTYYGAVKVYDIKDTEPMQGAKNVFNPKMWRQESNESTEEIVSIIEAAINWAKSKNISVEYAELIEEMGGMSEGGKVTINSKFDGVNKLSTLIHELAHEILHHKNNKVQEKTKMKEIDAETTAYIVLNHFGFEAIDTPNYLALWQAKGEEVKERRENIQKAVKTIINGIMEFFKENNQEVEKIASMLKLANEYWIDEDGNSIFADGDIGDYNHESYVNEVLVNQYLPFDPHGGSTSDWKTWFMQNKNKIVEKIKQDGQWREEYNNLNNVKLFDILWMDGAVDDQFLYNMYNVPTEVRNCINGHKDSREFAIETWGWKRVKNREIETQTLTPKDIANIYNAMGEILDPDGENPDVEINIDVKSTGDYYQNVPLSALETKDITKLRQYQTMSNNQIIENIDHLRREKTFNPYYKLTGD